MKQLYSIIFFFLVLFSTNGLYAKSNFAYSDDVKNVDDVVLPSATITASVPAVCINGTLPVVTFTGSGTAPYTFNYTLNGVSQTAIVSSGGGDTATLNVPTGVAGSFVYALTSVTDSTGSQSQMASVTVTVAPVPVIDFTFTNDNSCSGTPIQFNSIITTGTAPYTYAWDFGDGNTSTLQNPNHSFTSLGCNTATFNVTLTITGGGCAVTKTKTITVKQKPDINFEDVNASSITKQFNNCANASSNSVYTVTVDNISTSNCISSYSINWGDGNSQTNVLFPISHTYTSVGAYNMVITALGTNGCSNSKTYVVKNVSNPLGGLNSPGSTQDLCAPTTDLQFSISNWGNNSLDTEYKVDYGDGSPIITLTQSQLNSSSYYNSSNPSNSANYPIPHIYTKSSCPAPSFEMKLIVTNACGSTPFTLGNISILTKPQVNFNSPSSACINTNVKFTNTTIPGSDSGCVGATKYTWNFGDPASGSSNTTTTGFINTIPDGFHTFSGPGTYTVILNAQNGCGIATKTQQICIEPTIVPTFTLNNTVGCTPQSITATNTTVTTNSCTPPTYVWSVTHTPAYCGASITAIPNQTTTNASYNFTEPGTYTITLAATNSCTPAQTTTQTVTVKKPPTVSITSINNYCGTATINPVATVPACVQPTNTLTYAWLFPGGTPASANTANPGTINYPASTNPYTVSLVVTNECGVSNTATQQFSVNTAPIITNTSLTQTICSGSPTTLVTLTANPTGTTFTWNATGTAGITGFTSSGTNTIPIQTITNTSNTSGTVTYVITPTVGTCQGTPVNYVVTVNPAPTNTTPLVSSTVCVGGTPTVLSVLLNNTSGNPTYQWYSNSGNLLSGETSSTFSPPSTTAASTDYYCEISLTSGGCSSLKTNTATVVITPLLTISTQPIATQNICVGGTIPSPLSVTATGGTGTLTYQWYSNTTNSTTGATPVGTNSATYTLPVFNAVGTFYYYVVVSANGSGCGTATSAFSEVVVVADPSISVQPLATQTQCQNSAATPLTVTATDGIGTFIYQWYKTLNPTNTGGNPVGTNSSSYLPPTNLVGTFYYYCLVSQTGLGCSVKSNIATVVVVTAPQITTHPQSAAACEGAPLAPLTVAFSNGTGTATYQWYDDNGEISGVISDTYTPTNTVTTSYYCIITFSSGGCTSITSSPAIITINPQPTIPIQPLATQNSCVGGTISSPLSVTPSGGTGTPSYQWFSTTTNTTTGGTAITGANLATYTPSDLTIAQTYNYYVVITYSGGGCSSITSNLAQIVVVNDPTVTTQPLAMQTVCQNSAATALSVVASGGLGSNYSYQWYSNSNGNTTIGGTLLTGENNDTFTPPTTSVGTLYYYCVITQATGTGCNATSATAKVTINLAPAFTTTLASSTICLGQNPLPLTIVTNSDSFSPNYQWYSNANNLNSGGTLVSGETNATFNPPNSIAGTTYYYCVVTFPSITGGCSEIISSPVQVIINPNPVISNKTAIICSGKSFTILPVNLGSEIVPMGTTYTWTNPTISPAGSITGTSAQNIQQTTIIQTLINTTTSPATVTYTVTPLSGVCTGVNFTIVVTVNPAISSNVTSNNSSCFGANNGTIQTNITGGIPFSSGSPYTISWTGPNSFTSSATSISNLAPGDYNLSITDDGNCPINETYTITEPNDIIITTDLEKDVTCFNAANGEIKITISGGTLNYNFAWTKNGTAYVSTEDLSNLSPGIYVVTVSDVNNCGPKTATFTITEPPILAVNLVSQTNILCFGQPTGTITVNVVGGTSPYTYAWKGPNGFTSSNQNLTAIFAGAYDLIVTDNSGCTKNLSVLLTQTPEVVITVTTTPIICYGGNNASIDLSISGGVGPYQTVWNTLATGTFQNNLSAGNYQITVTDANNCSKIVDVTIPEAPIFTINPVVKQISCFGANDGSINLNLIGGIAPVKLVWNDGSTSGLIRNNLGPGSYTVTITDSKPCVITRTFVIQEPQMLVLGANVTDALDCTNANSGAINLLVAGGTSPFTYSWTNGATTEDLTNIPGGNYMVTVTDARGCSKTAQYIIIRPKPIAIAVTTETVFNCDTKSVSQKFTALASGGVPSFIYNWSSGTISGANNTVMETNQSGVVVLVVTDALGCKANYSLNVEVPVIGNTSFSTSSYAYTTYGNYSIQDPIQFSNLATGDYSSIVWDFGDGSVSTEENPVHSFVKEGSYVITQTVTYSFGCVYTNIVTLTVDKGYKLVSPNGFTPNGDGINDTFKPAFAGLNEIQLDVYDTWGELIYSEKGPTLKGWDGKIKGTESENGNYYYKVMATTFYGTRINEKGPFTLIK